MHLHAIFANPPVRYRPIPWWCWTGSLEPELLHRQMQSMYEQGIREFFVFPIYGIEAEYMSDEYLDRIQMILGWCRDIGMKAWIYDEYNWPSCAAGGRIARFHPEAIGWTLQIERSDDVSAMHAAGLQESPDVVHVCVVGPDGTAKTFDKALHVGSKRLNIAVYRLQRDRTRTPTAYGSLWCKGEPGMVDVLSPWGAHAFLDEAYEPIAKRFSDDLGTTIAGFFTDEPEFAQACMSTPSVPWTPELPRLFQEKLGYDLVDRLHDLTFDSKTAERTRMDFWSLVTALSSEGFTGRIAAWCEERKLALTGHMLFEESAAASTAAHGDTFSHLRRMHAPGCDLLGMSTSFGHGEQAAEDASLIRAPKLASSSARFAGRTRVMCEAFGVAPWTRTMSDEKRVTDWLVALGVNLINDNGLITTIEGFRKRALAGKHFTQPWWSHARLLYEYAARLSALCAETTLDTELAVLYPTTSWWTLVRLGREQSPRLARSEAALDSVLDVLVRKHWDFEFLFEDILEEAVVEDKALVTEHGSFRCIVLAGVHRLRPRSAERLEEFAARGGSVISVDSAPESMEPSGNRLISLGGAVSLSTQDKRHFSHELDAILSERSARTWAVDGPGAAETITSARRDGEGRHFLFLANQSGEPGELRVRWNDNRPAELWDASSGRRWSPEQTTGECVVNLPGDESLWLVQAEPDAKPADAPPAHFLKTSGSAPALTLAGPWEFHPEPANVYRLACRLCTNQDGVAADVESHGQWRDVEWGDAGVSLEPESISYYRLSGEFRLDEPTDDLQLVVDSSAVEAAWLNGENLGQPRQLTVWDDSNRAWDVGARARLGTNRLLLRVKTSPYYSSRIAGPPIVPRFAEPVVLRGSFCAYEESDGSVRLARMVRIVEVGDLCTQGFPHFVGTGVYERRFTWAGPDGQALITCSAGKDVVKVILDGVSLGERAWGPRQFAVDRLAAGEHRIEVQVANTLGGILRRTYVSGTVSPVPDCGLLSSVRIEAVGGGK